MARSELKISGGLTPRWVGVPRWGRQHLGYSPSGAQDQTSFYQVNQLLGQQDSTCLELILPPHQIEFFGNGWVAMVGANHRLELDGVEVNAKEVLQVKEGSKLKIQVQGLGARLYLQMAGGVRKESDAITFDSNLDRPKKVELSRPSWWPEPGVIRFLRGPEWNCLEMIDAGSVWRVGANSNAQGLRLEGPVSGEGMKCRDEIEMLSGPVFDGTVQLAPAGPIALLRDRQCIGGYPRVMQVIACDVDLLAQVLPGQLLQFMEVGLPEARELESKRRQFLSR